MTIQEGPYYERTDTYVEPQPAVVQPATVVQPAPAVVQPAAVVAPAAASVRTASGRRFAPDAIVTALVGLALLLIGLIAITRAGLDGPMSDPVVSVLGFTHTATLGFIEAGLGLCLLLCGATQSRSGALFFGSVLGIAGFVGAVQADSFKHSLALESSMAWLAVIAAVAVVLSALLMPRVVTRSTTIEHV